MMNCKHTKSILIFILALNAGCVSMKLINYDAGDLISDSKELKEEKGAPFKTAYFEITQENNNLFLLVKPKLNFNIYREWEVENAKIGHYEKRCKPWFKLNGEDCEFVYDAFLLSHIAIFGFFYDLALPFLPYTEKSVKITKTESDPLVTKKSENTVEQTELQTDNLTIKIGDVTKTKKTVDGVAKFSFNELKISPKNLEYSDVQISFSDIKINASKEYWDEVVSYKNRISSEKESRDEIENKPQNKYKMEFCSKPNILATIYARQGLEELSDVESNCIYALEQSPIVKVQQVVEGGILVGLTQNAFIDFPNRVFFIKTKKKFVDDQPLPNETMYLKYTGTLAYKTVLGAPKTVYSFQHLQ